MLINKGLTYLLTSGIIACLSTTAQAGTTIKVCDDEGGWPPYTYQDPKEKTKVTGAATDLVREILKRAGYEAEITLLPWKRCLSEVASGTEYSMLMNASYSDERAQQYLLSKPYYAINSGLFYLSKKFPTPPTIATVEEMKKYKYCGLQGYNYTMYHLPDSQLDMGARDEASRFSKLNAGQCDFILGDIEILKGFSAMGQVNLTGTASIAIPEAKPKEFYMLISRGQKGGEALQKAINDGLDAIKADGSYEKIMKQYGI